MHAHTYMHTCIPMHTNNSHTAAHVFATEKANMPIMDVSSGWKELLSLSTSFLVKYKQGLSF